MTGAIYVTSITANAETTFNISGSSFTTASAGTTINITATNGSGFAPGDSGGGITIQGGNASTSISGTGGHSPGTINIQPGTGGATSGIFCTAFGIQTPYNNGCVGYGVTIGGPVFISTGNGTKTSEWGTNPTYALVVASAAIDISGNIVTNSSVTASGLFGNSLVLTQNGAAYAPGYFPTSPVVAVGNTNGYLQSVIQNLSNGTGASGDMVVTGDLGGDTSYYFDAGVNSSKFSQVTQTAEASSSAYVTSSDADLVVWAGVNGGQFGAVNERLIFGSSVPVTANIAAEILPATASGPGAFVSISSFTVLNSIRASTGTISVAVIGTASAAVVGGGLGFYPYTLAATTTTTTGGGTVVFSTMTVPALAVNKAGQGVRITCVFSHAADTSNADPSIQYNNGSGVMTPISVIGNWGANMLLTYQQQITLVSELRWISHDLWSLGTITPWGITAYISNPVATQAFNEQNGMSFNCACSAATHNGDCSFVSETIEWLGM
jgi:hypothetical protein